MYIKWEMIKRGKELQYEQEKEMRNMKIGVDQTKEREEDALLREELPEKRREGGQWIDSKERQGCEGCRG